MIGSNSGIGGSGVAHDVHHSMQCAGILHGDEAVALEHELGHAHQHREEVVEQRRRMRLRNPCQTPNGAPKPKCVGPSSPRPTTNSTKRPFSKGTPRPPPTNRSPEG